MRRGLGCVPRRAGTRARAAPGRPGFARSSAISGSTHTAAGYHRGQHARARPRPRPRPLYSTNASPVGARRCRACRSRDDDDVRPACPRLVDRAAEAVEGLHRRRSADRPPSGRPQRRVRGLAEEVRDSSEVDLVAREPARRRTAASASGTGSDAPSCSSNPRLCGRQPRGSSPARRRSAFRLDDPLHHAGTTSFDDAH